jgi:hypothetical protein
MSKFLVLAKIAAAERRPCMNPASVVWPTPNGGRQMSDRHDCADRIAEKLREWDLCSPYGGDVSQSDDKRYYSIGFSRPRNLDGTVQVFSTKFILIRCMGRLSPGGVGEWSGVYTSESDALSFLELAFVKFDAPKARQVPTRTPRGVHAPETPATSADASGGLLDALQESIKTES